MEDLEIAKAKWESQTKENKYAVTEDDIAAVISMITGIPVKRMGEDESKRLLHMADTLQKRVIGQEKAVAKLAKTNGQKTNDTRMPRNNPRVAHSDASISSLINSL